MMRNDTLQTPSALQTPQLTSTVLRENRPAEHMPDPDSEPGSENDYVHKFVPFLLMQTDTILKSFFAACVLIKWSLHLLQSSDADVLARPTEDGGGEQERPNEHELHQVTQQPGRPADCVSLRYTVSLSQRKSLFKSCFLLQPRFDGGRRRAHL